MNRLFGHDAAVAAFRAAFDSGRLHHAWLVAGPKGVGKALFAEKASLRVLSGSSDVPGLDVPDDHPSARLMAAGSHPDFMRLERLAKEKESGLARNITVNQVRGIQRLFATTSSISPWRSVVIDSIDDLEPSAANALLKNLEEPPPYTLFMLVSHAPERLLPTIRSRCRILRLAPLDDDAMTSALRQALTDSEPGEIEALTAAGEGTPGNAIRFRGLDMASLDAALLKLAERGDPANLGRTALAQSLSGKTAQPRYEAFLARAPSLIARLARGREGQALAQALRSWEKASHLARSARRHSLDPTSIVFEISGLIAALAPAQAAPPR